MKDIAFSYGRKRVFSGYDGKYCKVCPQITHDGDKTAYLTWQMLLLTGCDVFYDQYITKSTDGGVSFGEPHLRKDLSRFEDGIRLQPAGWFFYNKSHKLWFGLGELLKYKDDNFQILVNAIGVRDPIQFRFDPATEDWESFEPLEFPIDYIAAVPSSQIYEYENGDILVPFYYLTEENQLSRVITVRYSYDGTRFNMVEYGTPVVGDNFGSRGLMEPSISELDGKFYLTLRSDDIGTFAVSDNGLHFSDPQPWKWDDGSVLENYNTMQHWVRLKDSLFLAYTRKGAHNDHVFRHRAPIFMARFDEDKLCLIKESEVILVPELGTRLGNFTVTEISEEKALLTTAEWMQPAGCEKYGSDNSIWIANMDLEK